MATHRVVTWAASAAWDAVLANDGAGSTLDADRLDDQHASDFAAAGHTHTHKSLTGIGANDHHAQLHAASHVRAGTDEIDGNRVDIDRNPSN